MASLNKVQLIGNVGKDPETREMNNGNKVSSLSLAVTETWKDKSGEKQEKTEWVNVVFFDGLQGVVENYVRKGSSLYIEGKFKTRSYEDKDGNTKYVSEVVVDMRGQMQMLGGKSGDTKASKPAAKQSDDDFDSEIPF